MASGQNDLIYVGIPRERSYIPDFVDNRDNVLGYLKERGRLAGMFQAEGHRVDRNRDRIYENFMAHPQNPRWLMMLDSDMRHPISCGERLTAWDQPVVGALYFHRGQHHDPLVFKEAGWEEDKWKRQIMMYTPMRDEVYAWLLAHKIPMRDGAFTIDTPLSNPLHEADAVGTGCMVIRRDVLEAIDLPPFEYRHGWGSEDLDFCKRVRNNLGLPIHADFSVVSGHYRNVAMGQAQFRLVYEGRGIALTEYTMQEAAQQLADFLGQPVEEMTSALQDYQPVQLAEAWTQAAPQSAKEVDAFYRAKETGRLYLIDLLHWNASSVFKQLRKQLISWRDKQVLEIGSGIGTLAMQLAIQRNEVCMVEPNDLLRHFAIRRWKEIDQEIVTRCGPLRFYTHMPTLRGSYDLAVAIDVFEHIHKDQLSDLLVSIARLLKVGGRLFYHNNWGQQDIYPMHYDHSANWPGYLDQAGLFPLSGLGAMRVR